MSPIISLAHMRRLWLLPLALMMGTGIAQAQAPAQSPAQSPASAPAQAPRQGGGAQTFADQQRSQSWATDNLAKSPRKHEWVSIENADRKLRAYVTYPVGKPKGPVVIVVHEVFGLTDSTKNTADLIAAMGYITVAPDMLSGFGPGPNGTESFSPGMAGQVSTARPDEVVNSDYDAWASYAAKMPGSNGKLAIVGLSWGGGAGFRYAAAKHHPGLKAVMVFYDVGPPTVTQGPNRAAPNQPPVSVAGIDVPIYGFYGSTDTRVINSLQATKDAMAAAGKAYDPVVYEGADHAYLRVGADPKNKNAGNTAAIQATYPRIEKILSGL